MHEKIPLVALCGAIGLAAATLAVMGVDPEGIRRALRITARYSYLWFWPAYAGGALAALSGLQPLARYGRTFGLAFVAAHSIHLILVLWLYRLSPEPPIPIGGAIFFGIGMLFMYLLAALSIKRIARKIDPRTWRLAMLVGLEYIEYAFLTDFWVNPLHHLTVVQWVLYLPFMMLGLLGTGLRLLRWSLGVWQQRHTQSKYRDALP
jgi:hypothetical protein